MRYLRAMMLVSICGLSTPAFAQICCPLRCRPTPIPRVAFLMVRRAPAVRSHALQLLNARPDLPDRARLEIAHRAQASHLALVSASLGQSWSKMYERIVWKRAAFPLLLFGENSADRAEDSRTDLSCPARQAKLASQCQARCSRFAANFQVCSDPNSQWQRFFGDIGGVAFGSAHVELLRTSASVRVSAIPFLS